MANGKKFGVRPAPAHNRGPKTPIPAGLRMFGLTAIGLGVAKAVKGIKKGVTKRRKMKFGYTQDIGGSEARAVRKEYRALNKKKKK
jgi:hypothetical protein